MAFSRTSDVLYSNRLSGCEPFFNSRDQFTGAVKKIEYKMGLLKQMEDSEHRKRLKNLRDWEQSQRERLTDDIKYAQRQLGAQEVQMAAKEKIDKAKRNVEQAAAARKAALEVIEKEKTENRMRRATKPINDSHEMTRDENFNEIRKPANPESESAPVIDRTNVSAASTKIGYNQDWNRVPVVSRNQTGRSYPEDRRKNSRPSSRVSSKSISNELPLNSDSESDVSSEGSVGNRTVSTSISRARSQSRNNRMSHRSNTSNLTKFGGSVRSRLQNSQAMRNLSAIQRYLEDDIASTVNNAQELFRYLLDHPPNSRSEFDKWIEKSETSKDPLFFAVIDNATGKVGGRQALLRIDPENGVIETGNTFWGPMISRTPAATEAQYLFMCHVFDQLGYRRLECKCHVDHVKSRRCGRQRREPRHRLVLDHRQGMAAFEGGNSKMAGQREF
ncbi:acetyltransferase (GNAT) domain-containing protein [Ditylenchus destructor]|uniref:Acetyltransferase (GNAT) domain-containing protein n=1 Tax=Ditylenchus destructor TaxID=166010 RepID=A0AAD4QW95_9BILA|nr:acetyltransferase (GNAT) domain-containing protein [Ditylenchus destructor]